MSKRAEIYYTIVGVLTTFLTITVIWLFWTSNPILWIRILATELILIFFFGLLAKGAEQNKL